MWGTSSTPPAATVIALTYGAESDWVKNVLAAGGCELITRDRRRQLTSPEIIHDERQRLVPRVLRPFLRFMRVTENSTASKPLRTPLDRIARNTGATGPLTAGGSSQLRQGPRQPEVAKDAVVAAHHLADAAARKGAHEDVADTRVSPMIGASASSSIDRYRRDSLKSVAFGRVWIPVASTGTSA